jgi:Nodulation protein Z (NodZ)
MRANEGVCSFEIATNHSGFFGQLYWCLCIFQYCDGHGLIPYLRLTSEVYLDHERGPNWFDYYFDLPGPTISDQVKRRVRYTKILRDYLDLGPPIAPRMSIDEGARTVRKYLRPKPHINAMVDDFWRTLSVDGPVVGVHFRGTDKTTEAPRVSWGYSLNVLEDYLRKHQAIRAVFVASDELAFIDFIKKSVKSLPVYSHDDHYRSKGNRPVHTAIEGGGYEKGEDALVNALLLAKCSTLIRTTSFLSAWASLFNPDLKVILLNKPYENRLWYPENEILKRRDTEYLPESPP